MSWTWQPLLPGGTQLLSSTVTSHDATGTLTVGSATVVGSASRTVVHATTGTLTVGSATAAGLALRSPPSGTHDASGTFDAGAATIAGSSVHPHTTAGNITVGNATVVGLASHPLLHDVSGVLASSAAVMSGGAHRSIVGDFPDPSDVREGVIYGPGGIYVGALVVGTGDSTQSIRSFTERL